MLFEKSEVITAEGLKNSLKGIGETAKMIMAIIFQQHNDEVKSLVGKDFAAGT
jgi:hypothetical protein